MPPFKLSLDDALQYLSSLSLKSSDDHISEQYSAMLSSNETSPKSYGVEFSNQFLNYFFDDLENTGIERVMKEKIV